MWRRGTPQVAFAKQGELLQCCSQGPERRILFRNIRKMGNGGNSVHQSSANVQESFLCVLALAS